VRDLDYDSTADTLLVGTQGRGAWVLKDVSLLPVPEPGVALWLVGMAMVGMRRRRGSSK
jgi:MYXO-CTERM domain-containing protein